VLGVGPGHPDLLAELAAMAVRGDLGLAELAVPFPLAEVNQALAGLREGRDPLARVPVVSVAPQ